MFHLFDVYNEIILPINSKIRILDSLADVFRSLTIPAPRVKLDGTIVIKKNPVITCIRIVKNII